MSSSLLDVKNLTSKANNLSKDLSLEMETRTLAEGLIPGTWLQQGQGEKGTLLFVLLATLPRLAQPCCFVCTLTQGPSKADPPLKSLQSTHPLNS